MKDNEIIENTENYENRADSKPEKPLSLQDVLDFCNKLKTTRQTMSDKFNQLESAQNKLVSYFFNSCNFSEEQRNFCYIMIVSTVLPSRKSLERMAETLPEESKKELKDILSDKKQTREEIHERIKKIFNSLPNKDIKGTEFRISTDVYSKILDDLHSTYDKAIKFYEELKVYYKGIFSNLDFLSSYLKKTTNDGVEMSKENSKNSGCFLFLTQEFFKAEYMKETVKSMCVELDIILWFKFEFHEEEQNSTDNTTKLNQFKHTPVTGFLAINDKVAQNLTRYTNHTFANITKMPEDIKVKVDNELLEDSNVFTPFDKVVYDAILSILKKNDRFDIQTLKTFLNGDYNESGKESSRHKAKLDDEIEKSITKARTTLMTIITADGKPIKVNDRKIIEGDNVTIPLVKIKELKGGVPVDVYYYQGNSPYFVWAEKYNQIVTIDTKMLQGETGYPSKDKVVLKTEIAKRISDMLYHQKTKGIPPVTTIKLESLLNMVVSEKEKEQMPSNTYTKKKGRYLKYCKERFDFHSGKQIKGYRYDEQKESFEIELYDKV